MKINLAIFQQEEYGNIVCGWVGDRGSDFCVFSIIEININQVKKERVNGIQKLSIKNEKKCHHFEPEGIIRRKKKKTKRICNFSILKKEINHRYNKGALV